MSGLILTRAFEAPPQAEPRSEWGAAGGTPAGSEAHPSPGPASASAVVAGYTQVLHLSLGRVNRTPFDLAGLKLYAELQAIADSLAASLAQRNEPTLRQWYRLLRTTLPGYAAAFAEVRQAEAWLTEIRQVLNTAALPTLSQPGPGGDAVALAVAHVLGRIADQACDTPWLADFRHALLKLTEHYWSGLFVCYDVPGVPRTNNDLEGVFRRMRRAVRRQTGFKQLRRVLVRQGAWLVFPPEPGRAALERRLAAVPREAYRAERARFKARQARFQVRQRWQRQPARVLADLEAEWRELAPPSVPA